MSISAFLLDLEKKKIFIKVENDQLKIKSTKGSLSNDLVENLKNKKAEIIDYINKTKSTIKCAEKKEYYTLSSAQQRLFALQQLHSESISYNLPLLFRLEGYIDPEELNLVLNKLIKKHAGLRTIFKILEESPKQIILSKFTFEIAVIKVDEEEIADTIKKFIQPFRLNEFPLFRAKLLEIGKEEHILLFDFHHIITDGISQNIIMNELIHLFSGRDLYAEKYNYCDYSEFQERTTKLEIFESQRSYWLNKFSEIPTPLNLPIDFQRSSIQVFDGDTVDLKINNKYSSQLKSMACDEGVTLNVFMIAIINIFLSKLTSQEDIVIGSIVNGRKYKELSNIVGMFVNTLVLRNKVKSIATLSEFLSDVKRDFFNAYDNQDFQFEKLIEELDLERDLSRNPLFDVMYAFQTYDDNYHLRLNEINSNWNISAYQYDVKISKFDLVFNVFDQGDEIHLSLTYCTKLFKRSTIELFLNYIQNIINQVSLNRNYQISEIEMISEIDRHNLLYQFNNTNVPYTNDTTIHKIFSEQVKRVPQNIAVQYLEQKLTYAELDEKSTLVAQKLIKYGVKPNTIIGLLCDRSVEMIIAIYGILKSGGAYLPISPEYPEQRINFILSDSQAKILLTTAEFVGKFANERIVIELNDLLFSVDDYDVQLESSGESNNLAYVIYTSGSTGQPKGVMIEHHSVINRIQWMQNRYSLSQQDVVLQKTPIVFDVSVWELFWWSFVGASLCLLEKGAEKFPDKIISTIKAYDITTMHFVPSMLSAFLNSINSEALLNQLGSLTKVFSSGEEIKPSTVNLFKGLIFKRFGTQLINLYGPTEATVDVSFFDFNLEEVCTQAPIGKPIDNIQLYIFDKNNKLTPVKVAGELCIGGVGLARGYLNNQILNNLKFIEHPYISGERIYKTGDRARWLEDGNIEFLGRIDDQVKIRGFRIELKEIENQLAKFNGISQTAVIIREDQSDEKYLCAYYISEEDLEIDDLRLFLLSKLPEYMVPNYIIRMGEFPITPNGKLNRKLLPEPIRLNVCDYTPPTNEIEREMVKLWEYVLKSPKVGIDDNFFNHGGDSIKAIRLISGINKKFKKQFKVTDLYSNSTIRQFSREVCLDNIEQHEYSEIEREIETLRKNVIKKRFFDDIDSTEIYPMSDIEKGMIYYSLLEKQSNLYFEQYFNNIFYKDLDLGRLNESFNLLVKKHQILRTSFDLEFFAHIIQVEIDFEIDFKDISTKSKSQQESYIKEFARQSREKLFDYSTAPLWRITLFKIKSDFHVLLVELHHSILDGWSLNSLIMEWNNTYMEMKNQPNYLLEELKCSYKEYILEELAREHNASLINYWKQSLPEFKRLSLPMVANAKVGSYKRHRVSLGIDLYIRLLQLAKELNTSVKHLCFVVYTYTISTLSYENEFVVGITTNNRPSIEDGDKLLGCFLNTVPFKVKVNFEDGYGFIKDINKRLQELSMYDKISLYKIKEILEVKTERTNPFFDTMFNFIDFHVLNELNLKEEQSIRDSEMSFTNFLDENTLCDFHFDISLNDFNLYIKYNTSAISDELVTNLGDISKKVIDFLINGKFNQLNNKTLIYSDYQKQKLIHEFNKTNYNIPKNETIIDLFRNQVAISEQHVAIVSDNGKINYKELDQKSSLFAEYLIERGVKPNEIIAVLLDRVLQMPIVLFGIIKSGAAYLPINTEYPNSRIEYLMKDSNSKLIILCSEYFNKLNKISGVGVINIDDFDFTKKSNFDCLQAENRLNNLVYNIYTSGSTGYPKGVLIEHKSLINRLSWMQKSYPINQNDRILHKTPYSFDVSVWELFWWSIAGASMYCLTPGDEKDPRLMLKVIQEQSITILHFVPSMFNSFINYLDEFGEVNRMKSVKRIFLSGETLLPNHVNKFNQLIEGNCEIELINLYGPTEATIDVTFFNCKKKELSLIPIGKPIDNIKLFILDRNLQLLPCQVIGVLYIGGEGLSRGYLNRPELTKEQFVISPFNKNELLYKTGDLARWLPDGNIEFISREDNQIKVRGYRIELSEIEIALTKHPNVRETVVRAIGENEEKSICAYIETNEEVTEDEFKAYLSQNLPSYMIPSFFVKLNTITRKQNGKIDLEALPLPKIKSEKEFVSSSNDIEYKLIEIWSEVLKINRETISVHSSFFEIGGDSLKAISIINSIHQIFNIELSIAEIFRMQTVKKISEYFESINIKKIPKSISKSIKYKFIEKENKQLYSVYHEPEIFNNNNRIGIVLCNPLGQEYIRCHMLYVNLANQLALQGFNVLRFDYSGTGDSSGNFSTVTINNCLEDIDTAVNELKTTYRIPRILLIGVRFGATLSLKYAQKHRIEGLVLLKPIFKGNTYLIDINKSYKKWLSGSFTRIERKKKGGLVSFGFLYSSILKEEINIISLNKGDFNLNIPILLIDEEMRNYNFSTSNVTTKVSRNKEFWIKNSDEPESNIVPDYELKTIIDWVKNFKDYIAT